MKKNSILLLVAAVLLTLASCGGTALHKVDIKDLQDPAGDYGFMKFLARDTFLAASDACPPHTTPSSYSMNETAHYKNCMHCAYQMEWADHSYRSCLDLGGVWIQACTICGYSDPAHSLVLE